MAVVGIAGGVGAERAGILIGLLIPAPFERSIRPGERLGLARTIEEGGTCLLAPGGKGKAPPIGSVLVCITLGWVCLDGIIGAALVCDGGAPKPDEGGSVVGVSFISNPGAD